MHKRIAVVLVVLTLGLGAAWAQEGAAKSEPAKTAKAKKAKPPNPTAKQAPEMAKLEKLLAGRWTLEMKFEAMPEMGPEAQAGTGKGKETVKVGPAKNSLIFDLHARSTGGPFSGHGVLWWDAKAGVYRSVWCDSETPACDAGGTGVWEGENLVFTVKTEFPGPGQKMKRIKMREMYSDFKPGGFTFAIDSSIEGGPMKNMMTIHYTKAAPKAAAEKMP